VSTVSRHRGLGLGLGLGQCDQRLVGVRASRHRGRAQQRASRVFSHSVWLVSLMVWLWLPRAASLIPHSGESASAVVSVLNMSAVSLLSCSLASPAAAAARARTDDDPQHDDHSGLLHLGYDREDGREDEVCEDDNREPPVHVRWVPQYACTPERGLSGMCTDEAWHPLGAWGL
jgi:hypothetical protein